MIIRVLGRLVYVHYILQCRFEWALWYNNYDRIRFAMLYISSMYFTFVLLSFSPLVSDCLNDSNVWYTIHLHIITRTIHIGRLLMIANDQQSWCHCCYCRVSRCRCVHPFFWYSTFIPILLVINYRRYLFQPSSFDTHF